MGEFVRDLLLEQVSLEASNVKLPLHVTCLTSVSTACGRPNQGKQGQLIVIYAVAA
jgi:hypothetical protein